MLYLLAKYTLLFLLSVVLGVLLGRWWIRRSYVDVTERYSELTESQQATEGGWNQLWTRLDRLDGGIEPKIQTALQGLPEQPGIDLSGIEGRLDGLERRLAQLPKPVAPDPVDLTPLQSRLEMLEQAVTSISVPAPDLGSVLRRLDAMEAALTDSVTTQLAASAEHQASAPAPSAPEPSTVDLSPIGERIADLERYVRALPRSNHQLDLSPMKTRLGSIEAALTKLTSAQSAPAQPSNQPPGRQPVSAPRATMPTNSTEPAAAAPEPAEPSATDGPQLFTSASAGARDNLKKISGVGPKLESLLNENGVYYFWQIASWSDSDIAFMDERLDVFKGRIKRDDWVAQAEALKLEDGAASESGSPAMRE